MEGQFYDVDAMAAEIDRLQGRCLELQSRVEGLDEQVSLLKKFRRCHEGLLVAYRTGRRPPGKFLDELHALKEAEANGQS
jgi:hypothetical protein